MPDVDVKLKSNGKYWQAYWSDPAQPDGRGVRSLGSKEKHSQRQALALCRQLSIDLRMGKGSGARGVVPRLSQWLATNLSLRTDLGATTRVLFEHTGRYLLEFFEHDPPIDHITRSDAAEWRAALSRGELRGANKYPKADADVAPNTKYFAYRKKIPESDKAKGAKALSESTVAKHVRCAKRIFEEAADEDGVGHIGRNPFRRLSGRAPSPSKTWHQVTRGDLDRILDACPNDGWKACFALCRLAGLRRGEAISLHWSDVDWGGNRMTANARIARKTTKKRIRVLPLEPARCPTGLAGILRGIFERAPNGAGLVCEGMGKNNLDRDAERILIRAGVGSYSKPFHTLRKNRETEVAREYPQHVLTEWFGHGAEVAGEFYLRVDEDLYAAPEEKAQNRAQTTTGNTNEVT